MGTKNFHELPEDIQRDLDQAARRALRQPASIRSEKVKSQLREYREIYRKKKESIKFPYLLTTYLKSEVEVSIESEAIILFANNEPNDHYNDNTSAIAEITSEEARRLAMILVAAADEFDARKR